MSAARAALTLTASVLSLLLAGCATAPQSAALQAQSWSRASHVELTETPFFPQQRYQCGPAALAMVLADSGVAVSLETLVAQVYLPARHGSLQYELLAAARRHDRIPYVLDEDLGALLTEVAAGTPVLVLQNLAFTWYPRWHYAVVIGYDIAARYLILRSGRNRRIQVPFAVFERTWRRGGNWAVAVNPAARIPETARELRYLEAVAGLERLERWQAARDAYRSASRRWPDSVVARLGLANMDYRLHAWQQAEQGYRDVIALDPRQGAAYNNLAQLLLEHGRLAEAQVWIERALALGGPLLPQFRDTREQISRARQLR